LLVELVIVSISPVPNFEPGPVSYIHWEPMPAPAAPLKPSLNTVDQPLGGPGTPAVAVTAVSAVGRCCAVNGMEWCTATATSAITGTMTASASASLPQGLHGDLPGILWPPCELSHSRRERDVRYHRSNRDNRRKGLSDH
jgi:hypothetical protein